ncbi:MAG: hypothetical protein ACRC62_37815 [Microcoleus sp.]
MNFRQQILLSIIAYPFILYAVACVSVWIDPYWYDDRTFRRIYIPRSERWLWAFVRLVKYLDDLLKLLVLVLLVTLAVMAVLMLWVVIVN